MLPTRLVGSVITSDGCTPFVLDTPTGNVELGRYVAADSHQREVAPDTIGAIARQVRERVGDTVREVRVGSYRCDRCDSWVDVVRAPTDWADTSCAKCA